MQKFPAHRVRPFFVLQLVLGLSLLPSAASAVDLLAGNTDELRKAIIDINELGGDDVHKITLTADITLDDVLTPIKANIDFVGADFTVSGNDEFQIFFVHTGEVTFSDMTLTNGASIGGDGAGRGGGGLGAGGALFVDENAVVLLSDVEFLDNTAQGGSGGTDLGPNVGGGGGGFHGDGGAVLDEEGGGGGGYNGDGGNGVGGGGGMEGDGESGDEGGNGGGEFLDGGGGAGATGEPGTVGGNGDMFEGGGGGGTGGNGGGFGGGGGGVNPGDGGDFGGGGGAINIDESGGSAGPGGKGGFGGGGGGSSDGSSSTSGFGGGEGAGAGIGGAGSSLGGAIFVRTGGKLAFEVMSNGNITSGNGVLAADAGSGNPEQAGDDFYLMNGVDLDIKVEPLAIATVTGAIDGEGGLLVSGTGTLVLTGTNGYTGGTEIAAGELIGTTDSLQGDIDVATDAYLEFDQGTSGTYAGVLSGEGTLTKSGTGTVTLSGDNTHAGPTIIDAGTLRVTTSSLTGIGTTTINGVATLEFDQDTDGTFPGVIEGGGAEASSLVKSGSGTVYFSGDSGLFDDPTTIAAGGLKLLSSAGLGGTITVESGGLFGGAGAATGDVVVLGTLAPGSDPGFDTLSIGGDLTMDPAATLRIAVNAGGANSAVDVTGTATVDGTLELQLDAGDYSGGASYDIVTAGAALFDNGLMISDDFCRILASTSEAGTTLTLTLAAKGGGFADCAETSNQTAVALSLDANVDDPALDPINAALGTLSEEQTPAALDQLGGEGLGGFTTARLAAGSQFINSLSHRMRDPGSAAPEASEYPLSFNGEGLFDGGTLMPGLGNTTSLFSGAGFRSRRAGFDEDKQSPFTFVSMRGESGLGGWIDGFAVFAENAGGNNAHDTDFNLYGTSAGFDFAFGKGFIAGAALGYTRTKLAVSDLGTFGTGDTVQPAVYGSYANDFFYVGGVARYAYSALETSRRVGFGQLYEKPEGSWDGHEYSGYLEAGLAAVPLRTWKLQPTASFLYTHLMQDGFTEKKATDTALTVDSAETTSMVTSLGTRFYKHITMGEDADVIPELRIRWAHEFGDTDRDVDAEFASVGSASAFQIKGADPGTDAAIVGVGWTVLGDKGSTLGLNYDATVNADYISHAVTVQLMLLF